MTCQHNTTSEGPHRGYTMSVAVEPYTPADPVAHGGIVYVETCRDCGAARQVAENAGHREVSPWSAPLRETPATNRG